MKKVNINIVPLVKCTFNSKYVVAFTEGGVRHSVRGWAMLARRKAGRQPQSRKPVIRTSKGHRLHWRRDPLKVCANGPSMRRVGLL